jgi:hypothetical protein
MIMGSVIVDYVVCCVEGEGEGRVTDVIYLLCSHTVVSCRAEL